MQDPIANQGGLGTNTTSSANTSSLNTTTRSADLSMKKQKTLEDYELVNQPNKTTPDLGKGSFGQVKLVRDKADPKSLYALKIINKKELMAASSIDYLKREIKIQKKLDHPHIIRLYHYFEDKDNVYLILEYAKNGNLFFYLRRKKTLTEKEAFVYFFQTCVGIDYLHKKGILHRDLKPENLLLDAKGNVKVCDFGWSAEDIGKRNTFCGTVDYMAPEMVQNQVHDFKIDIWSLGILLYELLHGHPPFQGKTADEKFQNILEKEVKFKEGLSSEVKEILSSLLRSDPTKRPGFDWIFNHPWIQKYEKEFGMSVKAFVYDPSKKKDKSAKKTPQDQSPTPESLTPTQETTPTKQIAPQATEIKTQPFSTDINPTKHVPLQLPTQSPKLASLPQSLHTSAVNTPQADFKIPSLNQASHLDQKDISNGYPASQVSSSASSRTNVGETVPKTAGQRSGSPVKGVNKAQELIHGLPAPIQDRPKSPSRAGIFSPASSSNKSYVDDFLNKQKLPGQSTYAGVSSSPNINTMTTSSDVKAITTPKGENALLDNTLNSRSRAGGYSSTQETTKEKYGNLQLDNYQTSPGGYNANLSNKNQTAQYQPNLGLSSSSYSNISPKDWSGNQFEGLPQENKFMTPKEQTKKIAMNEFNLPTNYGATTTQINPTISPSSQYASQTRGYDLRNYNTTPEINTRSPAQNLTNNEKDTRLPQNTASGDVDFFVPKADNIETTLIKMASGSKVKSEPVELSSYSAHGGFDIHQNEPVRVTRVTNLLQKNSFSDVDQIMEKFMKNEERPLKANYPSTEKSQSDMSQKHLTDHGRVTNIDKYLANYELEHTEENLLLDKLDNYYSTGNLQADKERYPKKEQSESLKNIQRSPEAILSRAAEIAQRDELDRSQGISHKINSAEISFQDDLNSRKPLSRDPTIEMSFADAPRESEEYSLKNNYVKDDKRSEIYKQHIQEENEEEDYYEKRVKTQTSGKKSNDARQKERERKEETPMNYSCQDPRRPDNTYEGQRQLVTGAKRREYDYQQPGVFGTDRNLGYSSEQKDYRKEEVSPYGARTADNKRKGDSSSFIARMVEQERKEPPNYRLNQKIQSYEPTSSYDRSYKDGPNLENQREDVMKNYRNRLNGLYHFNSEASLNFKSLDSHYDVSASRNSDNLSENNYLQDQLRDDRNYYNTYEREQAERRERDKQVGRGYNEKPVQNYQYQVDERYNYKRRKEDEEPERRRQDYANEPGYYSNKSSAQNYKSLDFNYEEMRRRRRPGLDGYMDDLNLDEEETVSRPSWRNQREIPKNYGRNETKKELGLIEKIQALFGCLDRTEKQPKRTRKGRRAY